MKKLLIVDDEEFIRDMLFEFISDLGGFEVFMAEDGNSSFEILEKEDISVIILDYTLPDIRGDEFLKKMKEKNINVPVILTSGLSGNLDIENEYKNIVMASLTKPFDLEDLVNILDNIK